ncbi:MAG: C_GCAxxG_C_C family protein [Dehalococcoidia bacterium]|nr:C_GCAxxG_C_C family protein [Dehalococcoidia bacterium]
MQDNAAATERLKRAAAEKAYNYELKHHGCGQCTLRALQETLGLEDDLVFRAASCLQGGFPVENRTCGALIAGAMVISMKLGRESLEEGQPGTSRGMREMIRLVNKFKQEFGSTLCAKVTGGLTDGILDEKTLTLMEKRPELFDEPSRKVVEICANTVAKVAEMVVDILTTEEGRHGHDT